MLDAVTAFNQWRYAQNKRPLGVGLWYLGSEDPSLWTFFGRSHLLAPPGPQSLAQVRYGFEIDFEGEGELLQVVATPQDGSRVVAAGDDRMISPRTLTRPPNSYLHR